MILESIPPPALFRDIPGTITRVTITPEELSQVNEMSREEFERYLEVFHEGRNRDL